MSIYCSQILTNFKILEGLVHIISSELTNNDSLCLFHVIELHKIWENPNGTAIFGKIITNEHIFLKSWLILTFSLLL